MFPSAEIAPELTVGGCCHQNRGSLQLSVLVTTTVYTPTHYAPLNVVQNYDRVVIYKHEIKDLITFVRRIYPTSYPWVSSGKLTVMEKLWKFCVQNFITC
jgi:hypothetical protein